MNAEIEREKEKIIQEWMQRAANDLESAEVILRETDNYEISAYHSHQAVEKLLKAELLKRGETFRFIHDLNPLLQQLFKEHLEPEMADKISFINSLYPRMRYPTGEMISKEQAERCLGIAREVFKFLGF